MVSFQARDYAAPRMTSFTESMRSPAESQLKHAAVRVLEIMPRPPFQSLRLLSSRVQGALSFELAAYYAGRSDAITAAEQPQSGRFGTKRSIGNGFNTTRRPKQYGCIAARGAT